MKLRMACNFLNPRYHVSKSLNIAVANMLTKLIKMSLVNILATAMLRLVETKTSVDFIRDPP